ncbi:PAS domain-containing protein [Luteimonas sp. TWI1416]|uniref:PAS domain-containing protein n=1 Tax=unclassified Luteimonas TaxID=2629088 RepID=UPI0032092073
MNPPAACAATVDFLPSHGEMAGRIAAFDWSTTPLGPLEHWPQSLRTTVALMLDSRFAMCLTWGPELTFLYNDAYAPMLGAKEADALGRPIARIWPDVWDDILPLIEQALGGTATSHEDMPLTMLRHGYPEETYWTFSYTPVRDEQGRIPGFLNITTETTHKVLAQRQLAAEAERLGRLFDQAPSFMALLRGPEHRFELANPGYRRLVGDRELIGRTVAEALPDAVEQGFKALLDDVYTTGRTFSASGARFVVQATLGGPSVERYLDFVYQPITDERGVIGIFVQGVDVTARALADDALREREAELRTLNSDLERQVVARARERSLTWQVTPDLLAVIDTDGCMETTNPAWEQVLGWRAEELAGRPWWAFVDADDHDVTRSVLDTLRAGKPVLRFENRWRTRGGGLRTLSWVATPEGGRAYCSARDVTDIKAAADALTRSQAQLRTLFETSYQLQAMCTPDGTLTDANRTVLDAIGAHFDDIVGRPLWETPWFCNTPGVPERVRDLFNEATAGGTARAEIEVELASGRRTHDLSIRPIRDANGRIISVVPEAIDTTERRRAEEALRQSQKLEAMGQLTGGVAHDFNNLLTPIFSALELAADPDARPERRERMVAVAQRSAERAATLVQRLLAFARRQPLQPIDVEVGPLVAGMAELIGSSSSPRIRLTLDIADDLPPAIADPNQLEMALLNLSVNACDAMPDGGVLTLGARNAQIDHETHAEGLAPGDYVVVWVADTGHGMDEATRARAIEPFFSTKGIGRGTGLGLSMAHGLASQLGGQLAIASAPQQGTTMELWLPVGTRRAAANADSNEDDDVDTTDEHRGTALVVDDEDAVRMCTADALDDMGYRVIEAGSAEEALAALESGLAPDVLVTDHLMPGMTGAELARTVRDRLPGTAVVIVSGYTSMAEFDAGLTILGKPFRQQELIASVEAATAALQSAVA